MPWLGRKGQGMHVSDAFDAIKSLAKRVRKVGSLGFRGVTVQFAAFCRHILGKITAEWPDMASNRCSPRKVPKTRKVSLDARRRFVLLFGLFDAMFCLLLLLSLLTRQLTKEKRQLESVLETSVARVTSLEDVVETLQSPESTPTVTLPTATTMPVPLSPTTTPTHASLPTATSPPTSTTIPTLTPTPTVAPTHTPTPTAVPTATSAPEPKPKPTSVRPSLPPSPIPRPTPPPP